MIETKLALEWTYTPEDFFEQEIEIDSEEYSVKIGMGSIRTVLLKSIESEEYFNKIQEEMCDVFKSVQLENHSIFELSNYIIVNIKPDGTETKNIITNINLTFKTAVEYTISNANGISIVDSVENRKNKKLLLAKNTSEYCKKDQVFKNIVGSFSNSISDNENCFFHLYEILDSLTKTFGSVKRTQKILGITALKWNRLGKLSNYEPLIEGRHRGKNIGFLRNATIQELKEAREISKGIILLYLEYLKTKKKK